MENPVYTLTDAQIDRYCAYLLGWRHVRQQNNLLGRLWGSTQNAPLIGELYFESSNDWFTKEVPEFHRDWGAAGMLIHHLRTHSSHFSCRYTLGLNAECIAKAELLNSYPGHGLPLYVTARAESMPRAVALVTLAAYGYRVKGESGGIIEPTDRDLWSTLRINPKFRAMEPCALCGTVWQDSGKAQPNCLRPEVEQPCVECDRIKSAFSRAHDRIWKEVSHG